jgi:hypothetical protein
MKAIIAAALITMAGTAEASSSWCYWIGTTYTCTTTNGGSTSTTRCYTIGSSIRCNTSSY